MQKVEVVYGASVDCYFSYKIIIKSSEKWLILEFKKKRIDSGNAGFNKIRLLGS